MSAGPGNTGASVSDTFFDEFIENYYEHLAPEDAQLYSPDTLTARAVRHRAAALARRPHEAVVEIMNEADAVVIMIVTDDMPFLVDSVTAELVRQQAAIQLVVHPTFVTARNHETSELERLQRVAYRSGSSSGDTAALPSLGGITGLQGSYAAVESWIAVEIERIPGDGTAASLIAALQSVLADVRAAVDDWSAMRQKVREIADSLPSVPLAEEVPDLHQAADLLRWLDDGNFTFLGYREYDLVTHYGEDVLHIREDSGLGVLRRAADGKQLQHLTAAGRAKAREKRALVITKANSRSTVHRGAYLDYIGVKRFNALGNVDGERRFIGLFATSAYTGTVRSIPIVRDKVAAVMRQCGFPANSHSGKDLMSILETYPRDELFQIDVQDLAATAMAILRLQERRRTRVFLRADIYGRFMSALVFLPRDRYTTGVRLRIEDELRSTFRAEGIDYEARLSESALARLFFRIRLPRGEEVSHVDAAALEQRLIAATRSWAEGIEQAARRRFDRDTADRISTLWREAFPGTYRVEYEVEDALEDIERFTRAHGERPDEPAMQLYIPDGPDVPPRYARLKLYLTERRSLSRILPHLHNLGLQVLDEKPFDIRLSDGTEFFLYDLGLAYPEETDPRTGGALLEEAFAAAMTEQSESDSFDRLVLRQGLHWRQVVILRSYARYMRQLGTANSYGFISDTLLRNAAVSQALIRLFEAKFDPSIDDAGRRSAVDAAAAELEEGLAAVPTLDADRVLRTLDSLIKASLRTNYFQQKTFVSIKINTAAIDSAPFPRPEYEIWVYSPRVEGVHLRFGKVARGGLRWSDRREDFRTEILGLVKAQTVKNAVIVPTGAKGGFFPKQLPDPARDRNGWLGEGTECYRTFIRGLLDITDNLVLGPDGERVVPPDSVVRHDGDDAYLVVAADKGTAAFSDIANGIAAEYGFWLGDAFASGGSVGYDHKAMGITARGAWESVKRHFHGLGMDSQGRDFTVVGIGDMSGDVFGNGMLLSEHIRLVAAFDHRHIFLDPDPDAAVSFGERRRLFNLPRSSWEDYDASLISDGGGVYPRTVKSISLSARIREVLGIDAAVVALSPPELLQAILRAPVDLLYNGGIGTYVKAAHEGHAAAGDKANDAIRINGGEIRARVVAEGGNLGITQPGRVEAALSGVLLNTDAIDNSAGVDCSDHEVNIKILVDRMVASGRLDADQRAEFLHSMTDDVAELVLEDNFDQNVLLLNDRQRVVDWSPTYERLMDWLEATSGMDRSLESLPTTDELRARIAGGKGLTSPELSVLSAYAKISLAAALTASDLADDPWFHRTLRGYFPRQLVERFDADLEVHPLRREIIATVVANDMVNTGGITFVFRVMEETSVPEAAVARAYVALSNIYEFDSFMIALAELPSDFPVDKWCRVQLDMRRLLDRAVRWFVTHIPEGQAVAESVRMLKPTTDPLRAQLVKFLRGADLERVQEALHQGLQWGLPEEVASRWAEEFESFSLLDIARMAEGLPEQVESIAEIYFAIYDRYGVDALLNRITALPREDRWQALARAALRDDLYSTVVDMTAAVIMATPEAAGRDAVERIREWEERNSGHLDRAKNMFEEVNRLEKDDMASLSVALRLLRSIVRR